MFKEFVASFDTYVIAIKQVKGFANTELPNNARKWAYLDSYHYIPGQPIFSFRSSMSFSTADAAANYWKECRDSIIPKIPSCYDINSIAVLQKTVYTVVEEAKRLEE